MRQIWGRESQWTAGKRPSGPDWRRPFSSGSPPEAVELARTDPRTLRQENGKGGVIYAPHAFRRCLGVVLEGRVQVNKGALIMSVLEPGDLFGAAALFNDRADYATTLTARAPCRVLLLPQALVEELMVRFPEVGRNYVAYLSGRICFLSGKIDALTAGSAERKVAQYLLSRLEGGWVELDCSAAGLARRLGVSRASLYRALDALAGRGVLRREGRRVQVLQPDALEQN